MKQPLADYACDIGEEALEYSDERTTLEINNLMVVYLGVVFIRKGLRKHKILNTETFDYFFPNPEQPLDRFLKPLQKMGFRTEILFQRLVEVCHRKNFLSDDQLPNSEQMYNIFCEALGFPPPQKKKDAHPEKLTINSTVASKIANLVLQSQGSYMLYCNLRDPD